MALRKVSALCKFRPLLAVVDSGGLECRSKYERYRLRLTNVRFGSEDDVWPLHQDVRFMPGTDVGVDLSAEAPLKRSFIHLMAVAAASRATKMCDTPGSSTKLTRTARRVGTGALGFLWH